MLSFPSLLQSLEHFRQKDSRHEPAAALYDGAVTLLENYHSTSDPALLKEALNRLNSSLGASRGLLEPCLMLAYLYYAMELPMLALRFVKEAESLDAGSEIVGELKATIAEGRQIQWVDRPADGPGDDALDGLEELLEQQMSVILAFPEPVAPVMDEERLESYQATYHRYRDWCENFGRHLKLLEGHAELGGMYQRLVQFEQALDGMNRFIRQSATFLRLHQRITGLEKQMKPYLRTCSLTVSQLEDVLDGCDLVASDLEDLLDRGYQIDALKPDYDRLMQKVAILQDEAEWAA